MRPSVAPTASSPPPRGDATQGDVVADGEYPVDRPTPSLLIVDDHPVFRAGMAAMVADLEKPPFILQASTLKEAWNLLRTKQLSCVSLDLQLPDGNGFTLLSKATSCGISARFIIVSLFDDPELKARAHALGADAYLTKDSAPDAIADTVRRLIALGPRETCADVDGIDSTDAAPLLREPLLAALARLTPAERRVLRLLSQNRTSTEIAALLGTSPRTVQNHRAHICEKLGLKGNHRLLEVAIELRDALGPE